MLLQFDHVTFTYDSLMDYLFTDLSLTFPNGWTGVVGPNGVGKSTLLGLATGELKPLSGSVHGPESVAICSQRTDEPPTGLIDLLSFPDASSGKLVSMLGIQADWPYRWQTLSHGERKRAQIGVALWLHTDLLVVDEPTNHLDWQAQEMVWQALSRFDGIGILVSHDRALLDRLCSQCLFLSPFREPAMRPGGVSAGLAAQENEDAEARSTYANLVAQERRLVKEANRRRAKADVGVQNKMRSKRGLRWKDSDARGKLNRVRVTGQDGDAGRALKQMEGRVQQAAQAREAVKVPPRLRVGVTQSGSVSPSDALFRCEPGAIALGEGRSLSFPELSPGPRARVGLVGPNGSGKSTFLAYLDTEHGLSPQTGVVFIPQELSSLQAGALTEEVKRLDHNQLGRVISTVSRLGSDPQQVLETALPSPGEARKLMLALGLERSPYLIVMDEPSNHLDLTSITCLEDALRDYPGALLLVSHDQVLLEALTNEYWVLETDGDGNAALSISQEFPSRPTHRSL